MRRRHLLALGGLSLIRFVVGTLPAASGQNTGAKRRVNLYEALVGGLRPRRPVEFAYLEWIVRLVDDGSLPLELVLSTFDWARDKQPYPFPYFVRGLRVRAARQGMELPDIDQFATAATPGTTALRNMPRRPITAGSTAGSRTTTGSTAPRRAFVLPFWPFQ